ncbi:uncharacterized protein AB675_5503 [Cyphellophora attinorum]|uniref:Casein kinase II beta 2 subunit n=1 Tax=Cyphellophora attinorum TaxID=1664694 RepID=A0A0N1HWK3_9EURO|nr:uncharacterized protein AB675_5503 [Phialophora attinorum]KPI42045.1 hypothetical protein AB675_5503 [Phialophora attinorum]
MASSGGHILVPQAMRLLRYGFDKAAKLIRDRLPQATRAVETQAQPVYARIVRTSVNRLAAIKQSQSRWHSNKATINNTIRQFSSQSAGPRTRASYPSSRTASAVSQLTSRTPFASQLRPNLTGGTLARHAGGYGLGGGARSGARYFSHSPAAPAQVINNVSQAARAFWLGGSKARFDGYSERTGEKRYRAVSDVQDDIRHALEMHAPAAKGSFIDFKVSPTITAVGPLASLPRSSVSSPACELEQYPEATGLNNALLMSSLGVDFARALKDLAAIFNDLKHLSTLGDLPIALHDSSTLRVRFPGCDIDTVEALCTELNIRRGIVGQDEGFDIAAGTEMALLFPFAPSKNCSEAGIDAVLRPKKRLRTTRDKVDWQHMMQAPAALSPGYSHQSATSDYSVVEGASELQENPWLSPLSGYSSLHSSELGVNDDVAAYFTPRHDCHPRQHGTDDPTGYDGIEGIHRFLQECSRAQH